MPTIRRAAPDDVAVAARTLALAFEADPYSRWTVEARHRLVRLQALFRLQLTEITLPSGELWVTDDGSAAAAWTPPGYAGPPPEVALRVLDEIGALCGERRVFAEVAEDLLASARPEGAYWLLAALGTRPERQGGGLGSALLEPVLSRCDAEGLPVYLETSSDDAVRFYERHGFHVLERFVLPDGGPTIRTMWRAPTTR